MRIKLCENSLDRAIRELQSMIDGPIVRICVEVEFYRQKKLTEVLSQ